MRITRFSAFLIAVLAVTALGIAAGCGGKSSSPTNTGGGGGGGPLNSGTLAPNGGSFTFTFSTAGTFGYHCGIHAVMQGNSITVSDASAVDSVVVNVVGVSAPGFSPSATTIKTGGKVRWVNPDGSAHSVVSD
jgi:plastocyanin